jgi:hypothetical protein
MQLFLDIDGVLLNFERSFVRWLNAEHEMGLPEDFEPTNWDFTEVLDAQELDRRWRRYLASPESGRMAPLIEPERFNTLAASHSVHLVTNFPLPHWEKRISNLAELGIRYDTLNHCGLMAFDHNPPRSKGQVVRELRAAPHGALFLDDHPENCLDVLRQNPDVEVWLMTRKFNRAFSHPGVRRAESWDSLMRRLEAEG